MKKKKILVVLGSGGHTTEILLLLETMGDSFKYEYLVKKDDELTKQKIKKEGFKGKVYQADKPRSIHDNPVMALLKTIRTSIQSLIILLKSRPDAVLSAGPGLAVPLSYLAKLGLKKVIFLESWSRVYKKSVSGKLVYPIADQFFVQWPELKEKYPKAIYAGRVA